MTILTADYCKDEKKAADEQNQNGTGTEWTQHRRRPHCEVVGTNTVNEVLQRKQSMQG